MRTARFTKNGGNIVASVTCVPVHDGSYRVRVWKKDENKVVSEWEGNFLNTDDDSYKLPKPNSQHDGRLLECLAVVAVPGGVGPANVELIVTQDNRELARDARPVTPGSPGGIVDLFIGFEEA